MALRNVTMPDGHVITDVPEDITDDEVIAKYRGKRLLEDEIPKAFEDTRPEVPQQLKKPSPKTTLVLLLARARLLLTYLWS